MNSESRRKSHIFIPFLTLLVSVRLLVRIHDDLRPLYSLYMAGTLKQQAMTWISVAWPSSMDREILTIYREYKLNIPRTLFKSLWSNPYSNQSSFLSLFMIWQTISRRHHNNTTWYYRPSPNQMITIHRRIWLKHSRSLICMFYGPHFIHFFKFILSV